MRENPSSGGARSGGRVALPLLLAVISLCATVSGASSRETASPYEARVFPHRILWERMETWHLLVRFDFGSGDRLKGPGRKFRDMVAWTGGMVREGTRTAEVPNPYLDDFAEGEHASLLIAAEPLRRMRVLLTLGDRDVARGPVDVYVYDDLVAKGLQTAPGEFMDLQFEAVSMGERIYVRLEAAPCRTFAVNGVGIYMERGTEPEEPLRLESVPSFETEGTLEASFEAPEAVTATLRTYADFILALQPREGCFSYNGAWYECAYPVRALLGAADLLDEPRFRDAALACVDRFVNERREDGNWGSDFFGSPGCSVTTSTIEESTSRNLADIGCMTACLPLAATAAGGERGREYLEIARDYADRVALPAQLESGAFPNGVWQGTDYRFPYSVATATQAVSLAALHAATGDSRYLEAASRAARFLAARFREDGSVDFAPADQDTVTVLDVERLGDVFYLVEGLIWVHRYADPETREVIGRALDRFFQSDAMRTMWENPALWFLKGSSWETSKRAGFLYLATLYRRVVNPEADVAAMITGLSRFLGNKSFREWMGVLSEPGAPRSEYSLVATGFAGLGMVSLTTPERLFPDQGQD